MYNICSQQFFPELDSFGEYPKKGIQKGVERTDGIGQTNHVLFAMETLIDGKYYINQATVESTIDILNAESEQDNNKKELNDVLIIMINEIVATLEKLTFEQAIVQGYFEQPQEVI